MNPVTMDQIEILAKAFAGARAELAERMQILRDEQESAKRRRLQGIKNALARVRATYDELKASLSESRALFEKPKTRILHGIKVGWMKQRGKLEWSDESVVIELIKKNFPDQLETLTRTKRSLVRDALAELPAKDLKRLGISVNDDIEAVLIKAADGDLDKLIDALINDDDLESET